jgi:hypothetical protein
MPTFRHGKNAVVLIGANDFTTFFNEATASLSVETAETTTFGSDGAKTYITGLKDATASLNGLFEGSATGTDAAFATAIAADAVPVVTIGPEGGVAGRRSIQISAIQTSYEITSPVGDVVSITAEMQAEQDGIDYGVFVANGTSVSATGNSSSYDGTASTANGGVANLHVTTNTRNGNVTFKVQHSSDNSTWADLATFNATPTTTTEGQRVEFTGTVNRYVRAYYTVAGSSGAATYTLAIARR